MNKNLLTVAIAAALALPMAAQAEIKLSGTIQAEVGSEKIGDGERDTVSDSDISGNGSANKLRFDISEKLGGGLTGFARMDWEFDTFNSTSDSESANFKNREKYLGLKGSMAHVKFGRVQGIYKTSTLGYDKWAATSLQARNGGGGMSGGKFGHSGFVDDVIEAGFKAGGFKGTLQYVADEKTADDGSILGALQYGGKNWEVTAAASFKKDNAGGDDLTNWKLAGKYTWGGLYMALQYENVEIGTPKVGVPAAIGEVDPTDYLFGQLGYRMGNVELIGWVSGFSSDITDAVTNIDTDDTDGMGYSLGAKYHFSKTVFAYAGWHETDHDADQFDYEYILGGVRMGF